MLRGWWLTSPRTIRQVLKKRGSEAENIKTGLEVFMISIQSKIFRSTKGTDFQNSKWLVSKQSEDFIFMVSYFTYGTRSPLKWSKAWNEVHTQGSFNFVESIRNFLCKWTAGWTIALAGILAVTIAMLTASSRSGQLEPRDFRCALEPLGATMHEHGRGSRGLWSRSVGKKTSSTNQGCDVLIPIVTWKADLRGGSSSSFFNSSSSSSSLSVSNK